MAIRSCGDQERGPLRETARWFLGRNRARAIVDQVQLRQLRFPSVNHLLYEPLYSLKPVVLENPLFSEKYDPVGNLREQAPSRVLILPPCPVH